MHDGNSPPTAERTVILPDPIDRLMKVTLTRHARRQMKWRKIREDEVRSVVETPDSVSDSIKGRENAFKSVEGRLIKVTYRMDGDDAVVITAMVKGE